MIDFLVFDFKTQIPPTLKEGMGLHSQAMPAHSTHILNLIFLKIEKNLSYALIFKKVNLF
jgi:hypothetical protein